MKTLGARYSNLVPKAIVLGVIRCFWGYSNCRCALTGKQEHAGKNFSKREYFETYCRPDCGYPTRRV